MLLLRDLAQRPRSQILSLGQDIHGLDVVGQPCPDLVLHHHLLLERQECSGPVGIAHQGDKRVLRHTEFSKLV